MKNRILLLIALVFSLIACNPKVKKEAIESDIVVEETIAVFKDTTKTNVQTPSRTSKITDLWEDFSIKHQPVIDTTNFDNINELLVYEGEEITLLQLDKIYPGIENKIVTFYNVLPAYKLSLSDEYRTIVLNVFKGEHELETLLVNYDLNDNLIDFKVISYDEIAEGLFRKHSKIENNTITITYERYFEITQRDTTKFHINKNGEINKIDTKFSSNLRPNKALVLNKIYTDTIQFSQYNDGGDYLILHGKKQENQVSLIYNWEWYNNKKYAFNPGELIKINWKMDSIFIAGDGETLTFKERAMDAERIISENKAITFLWRADVYDEALQQDVNSIFINEPFCSAISNQEKAALGYVATFIGNECFWDGDVNENRSNLKCKILAALNLGYQCSDTHLDFLQKWFSKDTLALKKLMSCPTIPYTATVQTTFNEILIATNLENETISVSYKAYGVNIRESRKWSWSQTDTFKYNSESITLMNTQKSEVVEEEMVMSEN